MSHSQTGLAVTTEADIRGPESLHSRAARAVLRSIDKSIIEKNADWTDPVQRDKRYEELAASPDMRHCAGAKTIGRPIFTYGAQDVKQLTYNLMRLKRKSNVKNHIELLHRGGSDVIDPDRLLAMGYDRDRELQGFQVGRKARRGKVAEFNFKAQSRSSTGMRKLEKDATKASTVSSYSSTPTMEGSMSHIETAALPASHRLQIIAEDTSSDSSSSLSETTSLLSDVPEVEKAEDSASIYEPTPTVDHKASHHLQTVLAVLEYIDKTLSSETQGVSKRAWAKSVYESVAQEYNCFVYDQGSRQKLVKRTPAQVHRAFRDFLRKDKRQNLPAIPPSEILKYGTAALDKRRRTICQGMNLLPAPPEFENAQQVPNHNKVSNAGQESDELAENESVSSQEVIIRYPRRKPVFPAPVVCPGRSDTARSVSPCSTILEFCTPPSQPQRKARARLWKDQGARTSKRYCRDAQAPVPPPEYSPITEMGDDQLADATETDPSYHTYPDSHIDEARTEDQMNDIYVRVNSFARKVCRARDSWNVEVALVDVTRPGVPDGVASSSQRGHHGVNNFSTPVVSDTSISLTSAIGWFLYRTVFNRPAVFSTADWMSSVHSTMGGLGGILEKLLEQRALNLDVLLHQTAYRYCRTDGFRSERADKQAEALIEDLAALIQQHIGPFFGESYATDSVRVHMNELKRIVAVASTLRCELCTSAESFKFVWPEKGDLYDAETMEGPFGAQQVVAMSLFAGLQVEKGDNVETLVRSRVLTATATSTVDRLVAAL